MTYERKQLIKEASIEIAIEVLRERLYQAKANAAKIAFSGVQDYEPVSPQQHALTGAWRDIYALQFTLLCNLIQQLEEKWVDEAARPFRQKLQKILEWAEVECGGEAVDPK